MSVEATHTLTHTEGERCEPSSSLRTFLDIRDAELLTSLRQAGRWLEEECQSAAAQGTAGNVVGQSFRILITTISRLFNWPWQYTCMVNTFYTIVLLKVTYNTITCIICGT